MPPSDRQIIKYAGLQTKVCKKGGTLLRRKKYVFEEEQWVALCIHNDRIPLLEWYKTANEIAGHEPIKVLDLLDTRFVNLSIGDDRCFVIGFDQHRPAIELSARTSEEARTWINEISVNLRRLDCLPVSANEYQPMPMPPSSPPPPRPDLSAAYSQAVPTETEAETVICNGTGRMTAPPVDDPPPLPAPRLQIVTNGTQPRSPMVTPVIRNRRFRLSDEIPIVVNYGHGPPPALPPRPGCFSEATTSSSSSGCHSPSSSSNRSSQASAVSIPAPISAPTPAAALALAPLPSLPSPPTSPSTLRGSAHRRSLRHARRSGCKPRCDSLPGSQPTSPHPCSSGTASMIGEGSDPAIELPPKLPPRKVVDPSTPVPFVEGAAEESAFPMPQPPGTGDDPLLPPSPPSPIPSPGPSKRAPLHRQTACEILSPTTPSDNNNTYSIVSSSKAPDMTASVTAGSVARGYYDISARPSLDETSYFVLPTSADGVAGNETAGFDQSPRASEVPSEDSSSDDLESRRASQDLSQLRISSGSSTTEDDSGRGGSDEIPTSCHEYVFLPPAPPLPPKPSTLLPVPPLITNSDFTQQPVKDIALLLSICVEHIAFVEVANAVWIAGWTQQSDGTLANLLHFGDQLMEVNGVAIHSMKQLPDVFYTKVQAGAPIPIKIKSMPHGATYVVTKPDKLYTPRSFGLVFHKKKNKLAEVVEGTPASRAYVPSKVTPFLFDKHNTPSVITEFDGIPLNPFSTNDQFYRRLEHVPNDREARFVVHPYDLVKLIKIQLKASKVPRKFLHET